MISTITIQKINKKFFLFLFIFLVSYFTFFNDSSAQARTYKLKGACAIDRDASPPIVIPPACDPDFDQIHYADRFSTGAMLIPADYFSPPSDPWINQITLSRDFGAAGPGHTLYTFCLNDVNGNVVTCASHWSEGHTVDFIGVCAYRICAEQDPCAKDSSPTCDIAPANPCLELPGACFVKTDGSEACKYTLNKDLCNADGDDCTLDTCVYTDEGANASCEAGLNFCSGIVPCGRLANNPSTSWDETKECQLCHIVILSSSIINFLMEIVILISILAIVVMGLINVISGGNASLSLAARQNINKVLYGFVLVFIAWAIVNVAMVLFGFSDPLGDGSWAIFTCNVP